jgi:MoaA/NifB/PqqE/SkfB family radical SAM enzyme
MKSTEITGVSKQEAEPAAPVADRPSSDGGLNATVQRLISAMAWAGPRLGSIRPLRSALLNSWKRRVEEDAKRHIETGVRPPGVVRDKAEMEISILYSIEKALARRRLSRASVDRLLNVMVRQGILNHGIPGAKDRFEARFGMRPPGFLLISPTKVCNLRCEGCYADSGATREKLEWSIITRLLREAREQWGAVLVVISGGEPLAYKDEGKTMLDLAEQHPESYFMMYTNGTLIDDGVARRLGELGNLTPAVSVEGLREQTDRRRGPGVFDKVIKAMERLRREKVIFGVSMTATRQNADMLLSNEVVNFYFEDIGASYGWIFHYMPIGRAYTLELVPTAQQRLKLYQQAWQLVYERHLFIADFWNSGTAGIGCISAGHPGGYLAVDWNGAVSPCVFVPYSPINIHDAYAQGQTLTDVWQHPFFARMRAWQADYSNEYKYVKGSWHGNWMMPCPIRDHYAEFHKMLTEFRPEPVDENAKAAMADSEYQRGMIDYDRAWAELSEPIWQSKYMRGQK